MGEFNANSTMNGLYGFVYDENGIELSTTQEFEGGVTLKKSEIVQAGQFMTKHKVMGGTGKGKIKFLKLDTRLQMKIATTPTAKYNYMGKLDDPSAKGEETVMFTGVSFDSIPLAGYKLGEIVEVELDFTFDGFYYSSAIL